MKTVTIGTVTLSAGMPKIGVVLTGADRQTLLGQAAQVLTSTAQVVVWRLSAYQELDNRAELINTASQLQQVLGTIPVIADFQTDQAAVTPAEYYQTCLTLVNNRAVAAIDIDFTLVNQIDYVTLAKQMRANGVRLLLSRTLSVTTSESELVATYAAMAAAGADIARMTIDGQDARAVLKLMTATATARQQLEIPLIATVTGALGRFNSVCGQLTGSVLAFGRVGRVGEPEQLPVNQLKQALQTLSTVEGA
ncbi:type I 3-dehydroquinate dehydratase [Lactiplantibacillus garii]|uniref:3-dehydroquinate dehydratase n=1 Tax=Lactiplantibacillus garii TaxID=2306423 RepID=A0A3R8KZ90_9LACO|nr:type I 3-dehydroquinate dehydratase [Lactiplantibacillus garii]